MNTLLFQALEGTNTNRPPVWIMRQAGRYMPSYKALRKEHTLKELFRAPKLINAVSLLPIEELDVDAAIIFSDILLIFETLGLSVHYPEQGPPWIESKWANRESIPETLHLDQAIQNLKKLDYLYEGIGLTKKNLSVPLFGFCGAPFTLLSYLFDREDRKNFPNTFYWMKKAPLQFENLLNEICDLCIHFAKMQIAAGADLFQVFESSGSVLDKDTFKLYSLPYLEKISQSLPFPCISFIKGSCSHIEILKGSSLKLISFDDALPMDSIRKTLGKEILLQGNLSPTLLLENGSVIEKATIALLDSMKSDPRFIVNLGHGILPTTPYENVQKFVKTVRNY